jgi:GT2 family glycosyltransferase
VRAELSPVAGGGEITLPASLGACVVTFHADPVLLQLTLASLARAFASARDQGVLAACRVQLIDNGAEAGGAATTRSIAEGALGGVAGLQLECRFLERNIGYGNANNLAIESSREDCFLTLNPDVEIEAEALAIGVRALAAEPEVALYAPAVTGPDGAPQRLCKSYPSVAALFARGFLPRWLARPLLRRLRPYELALEAPTDSRHERFVVSGCFMLFRASSLKRAGGFDPAFFLYFEDYDLSWRLSASERVGFLPAMRIVHHGGDAARKGSAHIRMFGRSALRFFGKHGWRWI